MRKCRQLVADGRKALSETTPASPHSSRALAHETPRRLRVSRDFLAFCGGRPASLGATLNSRPAWFLGRRSADSLRWAPCANRYTSLVEDSPAARPPGSSRNAG